MTIISPFSLCGCFCGNRHQITVRDLIEKRRKAAPTSSCGILQQVGVHGLCRQLNIAYHRSPNEAILHRHLIRIRSERVELSGIDGYRLTICGCLASSNTFIESKRMLRNLIIAHV
jgi:hypothetical protein